MYRRKREKIIIHAILKHCKIVALTKLLLTRNWVKSYCHQFRQQLWWGHGSRPSGRSYWIVDNRKILWRGRVLVSQRQIRWHLRDRICRTSTELCPAMKFVRNTCLSWNRKIDIISKWLEHDMTMIVKLII